MRRQKSKNISEKKKHFLVKNISVRTVNAQKVSVPPHKDRTGTQKTRDHLSNRIQNVAEKLLGKKFHILAQKIPQFFCTQRKKIVRYKNSTTTHERVRMGFHPLFIKSAKNLIGASFILKIMTMILW